MIILLPLNMIILQNSPKNLPLYRIYNQKPNSLLINCFLYFSKPPTLTNDTYSYTKYYTVSNPYSPPPIIAILMHFYLEVGVYIHPQLLLQNIHINIPNMNIKYKVQKKNNITIHATSINNITPINNQLPTFCFCGYNANDISSIFGKLLSI